MLGRRPIAALALGALCAACPARRRAGDAAPAASSLFVRVHELKVHERSDPRERVAGVGEAELAAWVRARLAAAPAVTLVAARERGSYQLAVEVGIAFRADEDEGGAPPRRVVLAAARATVPGETEGLVLQASLVRPLPRAGGASKERAQLRRIVEGLADDIAFQAAAAVAPPPRLVALLRGRAASAASGGRADESRLAAAIEIAAVRRVREAVPPLIELLRHRQTSISDRAIGALVAIGDRRAVRPLTRLSSFRDTAHMAKVIDGIGALGGQEARDYLEFVASGHDDADIRNLASEALERMSRAGNKQ